MSKDPIYSYLNTAKAAKQIPQMRWVSFTDKYDCTHVCFKDENWNIPVVSSLKPGYFPNEKKIINYYDQLGKRIELCMNYFKGKSNKEIEKLIQEQNSTTQSTGTSV